MSAFTIKGDLGDEIFDYAVAAASDPTKHVEVTIFDTNIDKLEAMTILRRMADWIGSLDYPPA